MKIKKIEMCGFKSFSEKIGMAFPTGVTAVVGPNGCGKSNVVDAIRWALGEQSPKQLRGKAMEDVIFNGTENRKPVGMAEVTLTFANENGHAIPEYMNFSEIAVSRRLFRSGESEYSINKVPCRLKDVTDLFLGTGVGHRAYSIVEQGKMDFVLNAKPEERRILIEEAAGVTKYKDRKAAALRKMEATQQNLLRLNDVIGEIKRQLNSLNRQAKKAERFKGYREEMRTLELGQAAQNCRTLEEERKGIQSSLQEMKDSEVLATTEMTEVEALMERIKVNLLDLEQDLRTHQEQLSALEGGIKDREKRMELASREQENFQKQAFRAQEEIGKLAHQQEEAIRETQGYEGAARDLDCKIVTESEFLTAKEKILLEKKSNLAAVEETLAQEKNTLVDLLTHVAQLKNLLLDLKRRSEENSRHQEKLRREKEEGQLKVEEVRALMAHQSLQLQDRRETRKQAEEEREGKMGQLRELQSTLSSVQESLTKMRERYNQESSRLQSLLELQKNLEGYQDGVRAILRKRQAEGLSSNGVRGLVEDIFETEPQFEIAVESVLGEKLQHVIVQDHQESLKAIEYLKTHGAGRSSFLPLNLKPVPAASPSSPSHPGVTPLLEVVRVKDEFADLASFLFGDVWIISDLQQALELWSRDSLWKTLVTLEGEVLHPSGVLTGGSREQIGSGTFHRKRAIRELTVRAEDLRQQVHVIEQKQEQILSSVKNLEASIASLTQFLHREDLQIVSETKELDQNQQELKRWLQNIETLEFEENQLAEGLVEIQEQELATQRSLQRSEFLKNEKEGTLGRGQEDLQQLKADIEALGAEVTEGRVRLVSLQEKKQSLEQNLERLRRVTRETEALLAKYREEAQESLRQITALEKQRQAVAAELEVQLAEHQEMQTHLVSKKEQLLQEREKLEQAEKAGRERRGKLQALQGQKSDLSMKFMELDLNLKHLLANIEEKYRVNPADLLAGEDGQDYFAPEAQARLAELKNLIESMGEVNLLAIQEYEESNARLEFLSTQEADLVQSLEALDQAIKKINRTTRKRFAATFEAVNQKFKEIFTTLFNGGRAELVLTDEANLLETGVDIISQPPGKKLQNVSLLSGGEKALTAVALIFALFLINPSPFCLLDEVDAPLDDANIGRFNRMIRHLAEKYQIILVTHNKATMEIADTLYGVTMEEPGTSKLVSVQLN